MANARKKHSADFKTKAAVETIRQQKTTNQLPLEHGVPAAPIHSWKKQALAAQFPPPSPQKRSAISETSKTQIDELHRQLLLF